MLSKKAKYGLHALSKLAQEHGKGPTLISDISASESIPHKFLELILLDLKRKGILQSKKGKGGGYSLGREPALITLGEIVRALDGPSRCYHASVRLPTSHATNVSMNVLAASGTS